MNTLPFLGMIAGVLVMYFLILKLVNLYKKTNGKSEYQSQTRHDVTDDLCEQIKSRRK